MQCQKTWPLNNDHNNDGDDDSSNDFMSINLSYGMYRRYVFIYGEHFIVGNNLFECIKPYHVMSFEYCRQKYNIKLAPI